MKVTTKIKLKIFALDLAFELIVNSIILTMAYFSNKIVETLLFYLAWRVFRFAVPKIFHFKGKTPLMSILGCMFCSCLVFGVAIHLMLPIQISIFSSVIVGILMNFILYKIQDYLDLKKQVAKETINIYTMTEDKLRKYAASKGLSEMMVDTLVLKVIHNYRWVEIRNERNYTRTGIDYHKQTIEKKLNIKL